jgi:malate dehydrogenase (oxaloacetate-decarboxylating)
LKNAALVLERKLGDLRVVISGAGAAGIAVSKILLAAGIGDVVVADSRGIIHAGREDLNSVKAALAQVTNRSGLVGGISEAMAGADVLIGVSGGTIGEESVSKMAPGAMVFALANPNPEVHPSVASRYASIVATGRSDFPNQINNVLAFPGIFRGALDAGATRITEGMKLAAANAIADVVAGELRPDAIVPSPLDPRVAPAVSAAVAACAIAEHVTR